MCPKLPGLRAALGGGVLEDGLALADHLAGDGLHLLLVHGDLDVAVRLRDVDRACDDETTDDEAEKEQRPHERIPVRVP